MSLPTGECWGSPAAAKRLKLACQVILVTLSREKMVAVVELRRLFWACPSDMKDASGTLMVVAGPKATGCMVLKIRGHWSDNLKSG